MATLQDFYPWVQIDCPGVPAPLMDDAIRKGAREFCKLTYCLEATVPVVTVAAQADYALTLPTDTELVAVNHVKRNTSEFLAPQYSDYIDAQTASSGLPTMFAVIEELPLELRMFPVPDRVETLTTSLALMPTPDAATFDDKLLNWYQEGITSYAKYYLMSQPAKAWSNDDKAAFEFRRFDNRVGEARIRRAQWRAGIPSSVVMKPFA